MMYTTATEIVFTYVMKERCSTYISTLLILSLYCTQIDIHNSFFLFIYIVLQIHVSVVWCRSLVLADSISEWYTSEILTCITVWLNHIEQNEE